MSDTSASASAPLPTLESAPQDGHSCCVLGRLPDRLHLAILAVVILGGAVLLAQNQADPDLWGHVQYGRDFLQHGLPEHSNYNYTAEGYRWINHENLAEILLALGADSIGVVGMLAVKALLGIALLALIAWRALRRGVTLIPLCVTLFVVAFALAPWWTLRPQLLSFVYATGLLLLLDIAFDGWQERWHLPWWRDCAGAPENDQLQYKGDRLRWLWGVIPLMFLWTNSHAGFAVGTCLFVAVLSGRSFEAWLALGAQSWGLLARFGLMVAGVLLATFVTPYGPNLHRWLLAAISVQRPEITEWNRLDPLSIPAIPYLLLIGLMLASLLWSRRERDFTHILVMAAVLWQAISHERHIAFLAILFGFWAPIHVQSLFERLSELLNPSSGESPAEDGLATASPSVRWGFGVALAVAAVLLTARLGFRIADMPVPRNEWPVAAFQYIADHQLRGKMVCTFNWAQYAIAAFGQGERGGPGSLTFHFDGRCCTCYPQDIIDMHFDWVLGAAAPHGRYRSPSSPPFDPARVLDHASPDLVLACRLQPNTTETMQRHRADWALLYRDSIAELWGRRTKYDDPRSPHYIPLAQRVVDEGPQLGSATWPALPQRGPRSDHSERALAAGDR